MIGRWGAMATSAGPSFRPGECGSAPRDRGARLTEVSSGGGRAAAPIREVANCHCPGETSTVAETALARSFQRATVTQVVAQKQGNNGKVFSGWK